MDLKVESSSIAFVEDNDGITNSTASEPARNLEEPTDNGYRSAEVNSDQHLFSEGLDSGTKVFDSGILPPPEISDEVSPTPSMTRKGFGLKKWKRIQRNLKKNGGSSDGVGNMPLERESSPGANLNKRLQKSSERKQKSEGSVSSTNAVERGLVGFNQLFNSEIAIGPLCAAGTDSENSEDHSSKSSTAASAPKFTHRTQGIKGFPPDKNSLSGKTLTNSTHFSSQVENQVETSKKARGELVEIEKDNSHSSLESDSRSSNFVFIPGSYSTSNAMQSGGPTEYDAQNDDEVQGSEGEFNYKLQGSSPRDCESRYKKNLVDDIAVDSSWELKQEVSRNHDSSTSQDPLAEPIIALHSLQEALEKELQQFKEVRNDVSVDEAIQDLPPRFEGICEKLDETMPEQLQSEVIETREGNMEIEFEDLFKQKIKAEVEYLVISRMVQNPSVKAVGQISGQKAKIHDKAEIMEKETNKSKNLREDISCANEISKLKTTICKYTSCAFVQLVLLVVILGVMMSQLSTNYMEVIPT